jgi:hypothetical protein
MESKGTMRILKAFVPMSEMLDFEPTLNSITGGRGPGGMTVWMPEQGPGHSGRPVHFLSGGVLARGRAPMSEGATSTALESR